MMSKKGNTKQWADYSPKEKKIVKLALWSFAGLIVLLIAIGSFSGNDNNNKNENSAQVPKQGAAFTGTILNKEVVDPATVRVFYEVVNTGATPGKPNCVINARSENGSYKGWDVFSGEEVKPGEKKTLKGDVVITKEGATHITNTTINCSQS